MTQETSPPSMRPYGRQILICEHGDCAPPEDAQRLAAHFRALARGHGLTTLRNPQRVKWTLSGCLGVCAGGPILVVSDPADPFGRYYAEILTAEGLNAFEVRDVGQVSAATLSGWLDG